jgi:hypothetical protein
MVTADDQCNLPEMDTIASVLTKTNVLRGKSGGGQGETLMARAPDTGKLEFVKGRSAVRGES